MGRRGGERRGNAADRAARRRWLIATFGDGITALCAFGCGTLLTVDTVTADRHPVPGRDGGTYRRDNIRPACTPCQNRQGAALVRER